MQITTRPFLQDLTNSGPQSRTPLTYSADGSKVVDKKVDCSYHLAMKDGIVEEVGFHLTDGSAVFAAEIHAIKEMISDALGKISVNSISTHIQSRRLR